MATNKINSRNKGSKAERIAAKLMAKWTKKEFARTPSSGGLNWKTSMAKGDIVCSSEGHYFPFCIEVKHHREINFEHLLVPGIKNIKILEFWEQCKRDALRANKFPLLFMRYDGLPKEFFFVVMALNHVVDLGLNIDKKLTSNDHGLVIFTMGTLLSNEYKPLRLKAKTYLKNGKKQ